MKPSTRFLSSLATAFDDIVRNRKSVRVFNKAMNIDRGKVQKLLELSSYSPSSLNMQPFRVIVISTSDGRNEIANTAMMGGNSQRVRDAPYTIIYLSDKDPAQLTRKLIALESAAGTDPAYVRNLPATATSLLGNSGWLAKKIRRISSHLLSPIAPSPVIPANLETWAVKSTSFAAMTFMLGASAHGLSTSAMEGYDERRLAYLLNIPSERFSIPLVISLGYALGDNAPLVDSSEEQPTIENETKATDFQAKARRYPLGEIVYEEKFGEPWRYL